MTKIHEWEIITHDPDYSKGEHPVSRLRVPGGWLYKIRGNGFMTFVPFASSDLEGEELL